MIKDIIVRERSMLQKIDDFAIRFNRIQNGEASEEERAEYELSIRISCMNEELLRTLIEEKAKELKAE